ncbi:group II intron maturase-specific domain-containing protein [Accumulibacter sp.]|uniref:group II intron maturase-specific domain-containing protein n=1 Tax=Accumulibacter sp. TaxID=2053492 RepID=UPI003454CA16
MRACKRPRSNSSTATPTGFSTPPPSTKSSATADLSLRILLDGEDVSGRLNRKLTGWATYFWVGLVRPAYRAINSLVARRLRRWLCKKHQVPGNGWARYPNQYLHQQMGLVNLPAEIRDLPWAKARCLVRERDPREAPVRFDERSVETGLWQGCLGAVRRKGRKLTSQTCRRRATSRLHLVSIPVSPWPTE